MSGKSVEISDAPPPPGWDEALQRAGAEAGITQSTYWARVLREIEGVRPFFLRVLSGGSPLLAALIVRRYNFDRAAARKRHPFPYLECLDGPAILDANGAEGAIGMMLSRVDGLARRCLATHVSFSPVRTSRWRKHEAIAEVFEGFGYTLSPGATYLVDLRAEEEELFRGLRHAARKSIKKCLRANLKVVKMRSFEEYRDVYWALYNRSETHFGRPAKPCYRITWDEDRDGRYHHYVAVDANNTPMAVLGMYVFNKTATEVASAISPEAYEKKIPAQDLLHWEMMLEAKRLGCHTFDLAGVSPSPKTPKEEGIKRFKKKWGGDYVEYNTFQKDMMPKLNRAMTRAKALRDRIKKSISAGRSR